MSVNEETRFDSEKALAELLEGYPQRPGPKLVFADKCAAYYALKIGVKPAHVCVAFGLTAATASNLKNAGERGAGSQSRYPDVIREFNRIDERAFRDRYYTEDVHARLMRIKYDHENLADDRQLKGPSRRADKFSFENYAAFHTLLGAYRIDWRKIGWFFIACQANGERMPGSYYQGAETLSDDPAIYQGDPRANRQPFRTSAAAHNGCLLFTGDRKK